MKTVIAYFFLFIGFCLVFRTAVMRKDDIVNFQDYINTVEKTDSKFDSLQTDMREWADAYKVRNSQDLDDANMPEWYRKMMRWFVDVAYNFQLAGVYTVGLIRYTVLGVNLFFSFIFA